MELLARVKAELIFDVSDLVVAEGLAMGGTRVCFARGEPDDGPNVQEDRLAGEFLGTVESIENSGELRCRTKVASKIRSASSTKRIDSRR